MEGGNRSLFVHFLVFRNSCYKGITGICAFFYMQASAESGMWKPPIMDKGHSVSLFVKSDYI